MAKVGTGAKLQLSASAITGTTGLLAELTRIKPPTQSREAIPATHHASIVEEFLAAIVLKRAPFTAEIQWVPGSTDDTALDTLMGTTALIYWKMTLPGSSGEVTYSAQGVMMSLEKADVVVDEKMMATVTIQPSGTVTKA